LYIYIYIYREREREREKQTMAQKLMTTAVSENKIFDMVIKYETS
jgi:hypothetical protein